MTAFFVVALLVNAAFLMDQMGEAQMPGRSYLSFVATVASALSLGLRLG